jgi:hypothetical protein
VFGWLGGWICDASHVFPDEKLVHFFVVSVQNELIYIGFYLKRIKAEKCPDCRIFPSEEPRRTDILHNNKYN